MMKKLQKTTKLVLSVSMLFAQQLSYADVDMSQIIANLNSSNNSMVGQYDAKDILTQEEGDADRLLRGLGEDPANYKQGFFNRWSDPLTSKTKIGENCKREDGEDVCTPIYAKEMTSAEKNAIKPKQQANLSKAYFDDKHTYLTPEAGFSALHADIKALEKRINDDITNSALKTRLKEFVQLAKSTSAGVQLGIVDAKIMNAFDNLKPSAGDTNRIARVIKDAQAMLDAANQSRDEDSRKIYSGVLQRLHAIKSEVDKIKEHHHHSVQDALTYAKEELKRAENAKNLATPKSDKDKANSAFYKKHSAQVDLYREVVKELESEDADEIKKAQALQEQASKIVVKKREVSENPNIALKEAESYLTSLEESLASLERYYGRTPNDDVKKKKEEIILQRKVIESLKDDVRLFPTKVNKRVAELLKNNSNDPKKALESGFKIKFANSLWGYVTPNQVAAKIKEQIDGLQDGVDKEAARVLYQKVQGIKTENNASSMNYDSSMQQAPVANDNTPLGRALAQFGLSANELQKTPKGRVLQADLAKILDERDLKVKNTEESIQWSPAQKSEMKRKYEQEMAAQLSNKILASKGAVSLDTARSGDLGAIGSELVSNNVRNYLLGGQ